MNNMTRITLFYITHESKEHAQTFVEQLIQQKLIACGNSYPIDSVYLWQARMQKDDEYVSLLKSLPAKKDEVIKTIERIHPYETPCILTWEVECNEAYAQWIAEQLR